MLCADHIDRYVAWVVYSLLNGALGDLVKHDSMHRLVIERIFFFQKLDEMPGDSLTLTIRVSCEIESIGLLQRADDGINVLFVTLDDLVLHLETLFGIDGTHFGYQITNVAV